MGAQRLPQAGATVLLARPWIALQNVPLLSGLTLYGVFTLLFIIALKDAELSIIYPVIALSYVWVTLLSIVFFHETINPYKACGIAIIMIGVTVLGKGGDG